MKITSVKVRNFVRLAEFDTDTPAPILFVAGGNEAGKTTLHNAMRLAMLGELSRVKLKGDADQLIHAGAKKAEIEIITTHGAYAASITKSQTKTCDTPYSSFLPYALDPASIARLPEKDFRRLVYSVAGIDAKSAWTEIQATLAKIADDDKVAAAMNAIKAGGLDGGLKWARSQASEARGAWKAATGETYGASKAAEWSADIPEALSDDAIRAMQSLVADKIKKLGAIEKKLSKPAAVLPEGETIESLTKYASHHDETVKARETVMNRLRVVQDTLSSLMSCPHCEGPVKYLNGALLPATGISDKDQAAKLRAEMENLLTHADELFGQIQEQKKAADLVEALASADEDRADMEQQATTLRAEIDKLNADVVAAVNDAASAKQLATAVETAAAAHTDVQAWTAIADELEPTGIQARFAKQALEPINTALTSLAAMSEWPAVTIGEDMAIMSGGMPYCLLSESRQWRCDLMLAMAMAFVSGLKFVAIDRVDVLEPAARERFLDLMCDAVDAGIIEGAVATATLKAKPDLDPEYFTVHWLGA